MSGGYVRVEQVGEDFFGDERVEVVLFIFEVDQAGAVWGPRLGAEVVFVLLVRDRVVAEHVGVLLVLDRNLRLAASRRATLSPR